jgi:hypothetical protein
MHDYVCEQVRKRAQACVVEVLAGLQSSQVLVPASEAVVRTCQAVLKGPEVRVKDTHTKEVKELHPK